MADVLVAGGGPAGAMLAICAGRAGISVDVFDGARFPRDKPCGEGLMPAGVGVLERLGLESATGGQAFYGVRYRGFGITAQTHFPGGDPSDRAAHGTVSDTAAHGRGQRRTVFDAALLQAARSTPHVRVFEGATVDGVVRRGQRAVGLRIDGATIPGGLIVGADGARSTVRRHLGLDGSPDARPRLGLRMHFRLAPDRQIPDVVDVFVGDAHEIYVTPLPGHQVLVAALAERGPIETNARGALEAWIAQHPGLADLLCGAEAISTPRGRFPLRHRARAGVAPGAVLLGDAAGFCDPITGGGMAQALLSAELLALYLPRALADRDDEWLWRFDIRRRRLFRDYVVMTSGLLALARRSTTARWALGGMRASPTMMRRLVGVAAGMTRLVPLLSSTPPARALNQAVGIVRRTAPTPSLDGGRTDGH